MGIKTPELDEAVRNAAAVALSIFKEGNLKAHDKFNRLSEEAITAAEDLIPSYVIALFQIILRQAIVEGHLTGLERMPARKILGILNVKFYDACKEHLVDGGFDKRTATRVSKNILYRTDLLIRETQQRIIENASILMTTVVLNKVFYGSIVGGWTEKTTPEEVTIVTYLNDLSNQVREKADRWYW